MTVSFTTMDCSLLYLKKIFLETFIFIILKTSFLYNISLHLPKTFVQYCKKKSSIKQKSMPTALMCLDGENLIHFSQVQTHFKFKT